MTDRELLELAAKAAGYEIEVDQYEVIYYRDGSGPQSWAIWNPLTCDGDALRLAVKLRLMVAWNRWNDNDYVCIRHRDLDEELAVQIYRSPDQTVRRAIVRAAAEIGGAM